MAVDQELLEDAVHNTIGFPLQSLLVRDDEDMLTSPELPEFEPPPPRTPKSELLRRVQLGIEDEIDKWVLLAPVPRRPSLIKINYIPFMVGFPVLRASSKPNTTYSSVSANAAIKGTDSYPNSGSTLCGIVDSRVTKLFFYGPIVSRKNMYLPREVMLQYRLRMYGSHLSTQKSQCKAANS